MGDGENINLIIIYTDCEKISLSNQRQRQKTFVGTAALVAYF
jgi:hypothetical protein